MTLTWLPAAHVVDLSGSRGNGPFPSGQLLGVVLHVNVDETGTTDDFFAAGPPRNPDQVCPNFQVYKDGTVHQYLPLNWQPWCQADGNYRYAAVETAGLPSEPLTAAQISAIATILRAYHDELGVPLQLANTPGERGLGIHSMGGADWGGHTCPGDIRAGQRAVILAAASSSGTAPPTPPAQQPQEDPDVYTNLRPGDEAAIPAPGLTRLLLSTDFGGGDVRAAVFDAHGNAAPLVTGGAAINLKDRFKFWLGQGQAFTVPIPAGARMVSIVNQGKHAVGVRAL